MYTDVCGDIAREDFFYLVSELELDTSGSMAPLLLSELQGGNKESVNVALCVSCELKGRHLYIFIDVSFICFSSCK